MIGTQSGFGCDELVGPIGWDIRHEHLDTTSSSNTFFLLARRSCTFRRDCAWDGLLCIVGEGQDNQFLSRKQSEREKPKI